MTIKRQAQASIDVVASAGRAAERLSDTVRRPRNGHVPGDPRTMHTVLTEKARHQELAAIRQLVRGLVSCRRPACCLLAPGAAACRRLTRPPTMTPKHLA